ncbi:pyrokinin-1 receptor [Patella vulgata]|uniref:pyrokinin-1 receptor n=1 Tax=Patella vulgata TaxID=6465 RepID=UPI0024A971D5|nr:pyrokinin-1 receptor [Patella vulgata]
MAENVSSSVFGIGVNTSNQTIGLEEELGSKAAVPITFVYILIFITGVFGNICTCIIIIKNRYMHTPTNYYLFNLAVSDLMMLVLGLPYEIYTLWSSYPFLLGETICRLRLLAAEASTYTSILTITAFTVERYNAICYPMRANNSNLSRVVKVIISIWSLSVLCSIPVALQFGIIYDTFDGNVPISESAQCNTINESEAKIVFQVSTFLFFIFPMTVIGILYFMIALAIRRSVLIRSGSDSSNDSQTTSASVLNPDTRGQQQSLIRQSVLKMLVAVVVAFFVCWAPFHAQRLLVVYVEDWTSTLMQVHDCLYYISGVLYYISSTINPILYSIMSVKFRQAFRSTILFPCCQTNRRKSRNSYTYKFSHQKNSGDTNCTPVESSPPARCCVPVPPRSPQRCDDCPMERISWKGNE